MAKKITQIKVGNEVYQVGGGGTSLHYIQENLSSQSVQINAATEIHPSNDESHFTHIGNGGILVNNDDIVVRDTYYNEDYSLRYTANRVTNYGYYYKDLGIFTVSEQVLCHKEGNNLIDLDGNTIEPEVGKEYLDVSTKTVYMWDSESLIDITSITIKPFKYGAIYVDIFTNNAFISDGTTLYHIKDDTKADDVPTFTEAATRANLAGSGESTLTLWGKIKKWFTDLKSVAFSGNYKDLNNKPLSVENNKVKYTLSDGQTKLTLIQDTDVATTSASGLMSAEDKEKVDRIGTVIYKGSLQHNLSVMTSGLNLIHVHCQDLTSDNIYLDCYISASGTIGSDSTFTWNYAFIHTDSTNLSIVSNYNGLVNVVNNTGRPDTDFLLFINRLI